MDPLTYLTTPTTSLDIGSWIVFVAQIAAMVAGIYLSFLRNDDHPVRGLVSRQLGYALMALGGTGVAVGALRLAAVEPFTMPLWLYLALLFDLLLLGYALYYTRAVLPALIAAAPSRRGSGRQSATRLPSGANGAAPSDPRPVATTGRRDARRDRKRRNR